MLSVHDSDADPGNERGLARMSCHGRSHVDAATDCEGPVACVCTSSDPCHTVDQLEDEAHRFATHEVDGRSCKFSTVVQARMGVQLVRAVFDVSSATWGRSQTQIQ